LYLSSFGFHAGLDLVASAFADGAVALHALRRGRFIRMLGACAGGGGGAHPAARAARAAAAAPDADRVPDAAANHATLRARIKR